MNARHAIYTAATECQDCYKCIRGCPVKAIKVEGGYASIEPERCICCGGCVQACPNGAKKVRDDLPRVERLLAGGARVVVSLAPSFASEFPGIRAGQLAAALLRLGFHAVSETALGAQEVSAGTRRLLREGPRVLLSTACPVAVEYVRKYRPDCAPLLTPLLSPMLSHALLLRAELGGDVHIVFIGPCIGKKGEADAHPELIDAALTFEDLHGWLRRAGVDPAGIVAADEAPFVPRAAGAGAFSPVEGGMIRGVRDPAVNAQFMSFSGLGAVARALDGIEDMHPASPLFIELLACEGGCINGPKTAGAAGTVRRRSRVLRYAREGADGATGVSIGGEYGAAPADVLPAPHEQQIREVLRSVGKRTPADELNCGGCGYDSCRAFAAAFLMGRAERRMCVTYMRKLAEKKSHALLQKMPSAVVIVDDALRVLECNPSFVRFFAPDAAERPASLEGRPLDQFVPFYSLFERVLQTGEEIHGKDVRFHGSVLHVTVFSIEKGSMVGGIFRDETRPAVQKEQIIERTRQVIEKNLHTVQQIAYLLGENAAESEIALNSIVESFSPTKLDDNARDE